MIESAEPELRSGQKKDSLNTARQRVAGVSVVLKEGACEGDDEGLQFIQKAGKLETRPSDSDASIDYLDLGISACSGNEAQGSC